MTTVLQQIKQEVKKLKMQGKLKFNTFTGSGGDKMEERDLSSPAFCDIKTVKTY